MSNTRPEAQKDFEIPPGVETTPPPATKRRRRLGAGYPPEARPSDTRMDPLTGLDWESGSSLDDRSPGTGSTVSLDTIPEKRSARTKTQRALSESAVRTVSEPAVTTVRENTPEYGRVLYDTLSDLVESQKKILKCQKSIAASQESMISVHEGLLGKLVERFTEVNAVMHGRTPKRKGPVIVREGGESSTGVAPELAKSLFDFPHQGRERD
ncbi:hypothetical protein LTR37_013205 [Vermiconidia calcicola]|uniref:Uncharacterized protein n=1 Tax=Vermiconidia calcicola TaxID=1690605 RepID=A0ACC3MXI3_9PEZI|nr:hypothetical protein LTR37_013205 [Vermiconidia calcicola]